MDHSSQLIDKHISEAFFDIVNNYGTIFDIKRKNRAIVKKIEKWEGVYAPILSEELEAFNKAYFYRNLLKNLLGIDYLKGNFETNQFIDLGCGVGTASVALSSIAFDETNDDKKITLVDQSDLQIRLAKCTISKLLRSDIEHSYSNEYQSVVKNHIDPVTVLSYSLCELYSSAKDKWFLAESTDKLFIIDYRRTILRFLNENRSRFNRIEFLSQTYELDKALSKIIGQERIKLNAAFARKN